MHNGFPQKVFHIPQVLWKNAKCRIVVSAGADDPLFAMKYDLAILHLKAGVDIRRNVPDVVLQGGVAVFQHYTQSANHPAHVLLP